MKKLIGISISTLLFIGCGKNIDYSGADFSAATFINASPSGAIFNVVVDNINQTATSLVYRASTSYLNVRPGARNIIFRSNNPSKTVDYITLSGENFETNKAATFIAYDTLLTTTGILKVVRLKDTLTAISDGQIKVRFVPLAVNASAVDITFLRTTVTPNDSVTISNQSYIGGTPTAARVNEVSRFLQIPGGNYTIKQKIAGTQTVLTSNAITTTVGGIYKGYFTVYSTGTAQGQPLVMGVVRQFP